MGHAPGTLPQLRWGIIGTGLISSWFVTDLGLTRPDAEARHVIQAIGSSSIAKGQAFAAKFGTSCASAAVYGSYKEVYNDVNVDVVYIGTPHAFHKGNCLEAIAAGKHVLCEKPFTINATEASEVLAMARAKGVFIMEAMWTRFTPLVRELRAKLFDERAIGDVQRTFCDFGLDMNIAELGPESRLKNSALGAGALLDIGIYSLSWGLWTLDPAIGDARDPSATVTAVQSLSDGIDLTTSLLLHYPGSGRQGILTATMTAKSDRTFCRIEGSEGYITVEGPAASAPESFTVWTKTIASAKGDMSAAQSQGDHQLYTFDKSGKGFYHEADAVAKDIAAGRTENSLMPHAETLVVMKIMDNARKQGGVHYPQDSAPAK